MIKNYSSYRKNAKKVSKIAILKEKNTAKYFVYALSSLISRLIFVFRPSFNIASIRVGENAIEHKNFYLLDTYEDACKRKIYKKALYAYLLKTALLVGGILTITIITGLLFGMGYFIGMGLKLLGIGLGIEPLYMGLGVGLIGVIGLFIYIINFIIYTNGVYYILDKNSDIEVVSAFIASYKTFVKGGRKIIVKNFFATIIGIILSLIPSIALVVTGAIMGGGISYFIITIGVVFLLIGFKWIARNLVTYKATKILLFRDILFIPQAKVDAPKGLKIERISQSDVDPSVIANGLVGLFNEDDKKYEESEETLSTILSNRISTKKTKLEEVNYVKKNVNEPKIEEENNEEEKIQEAPVKKQYADLTKKQIKKMEKLQKKNKRLEELNDEDKEVPLTMYEKILAKSEMALNQSIDPEFSSQASEFNEFNVIKPKLTREERREAKKEEKYLAKLAKKKNNEVEEKKEEVIEEQPTQELVEDTSSPEYEKVEESVIEQEVEQIKEEVKEETKVDETIETSNEEVKEEE